MSVFQGKTVGELRAFLATLPDETEFMQGHARITTTVVTPCFVPDAPERIVVGIEAAGVVRAVFARLSQTFGMEE